MTPTEDAGPSRSATTWALIITSVAGFMIGLDNLIVTTALPAIRKDLGGGLEDLSWTVNAYTLSFAALLMTGSALGDRFGRRRLFGAGLAVFTAASAAAALAPNLATLIAARAAQGAGAAVLLPLTLTLLTVAVPTARRGMAFGIWGGVNGMAIAIGPMVGGAVIDQFSWQWIFWLNVPIGVLLLPLARLRLAESHGQARRLDLVGTALASSGVFGIVLSLVRGENAGWGSAGVLAGFAGGALLLAAFVRWELRNPAPMLPLRLFRSRSFSAINIVGLLNFFGLYGAVFLLTQYLQGVQGYTPLQAGLRMLPWTAMPIAVTPLAGALSDRIGGRTILTLGLAVQAVGMGWYAAVATPQVSYAAQVPALIVSGVGMSLFLAPVANVVMGSVRPEEQGIASGASTSLRNIGGVLGVAVFGAVFSAQGGYGSARQFVDGLTPALWIGAAALGLASLVALALPRGRTGDNATPRAQRHVASSEATADLAAVEP
ncbi:DHA2 family efflux MFS transporter permease subunit [Streptomyces gibsoniae]|uniref:DHA2 family efflux MFS transporter permease subunit n=1 Tax=Streptomyces gibsoniae TaxID=3075529 RepID=A0ABU2TKJ7_9ACTN|nr:DHA2 family efflux MFS transporter permease subunit [Streptomyces sp. DSM 41699]MDT0461443.1 DHA2 family efflux MFS transporter permease subunit [Streptomyces sp. DSM 41699]